MVAEKVEDKRLPLRSYLPSIRRVLVIAFKLSKLSIAFKAVGSVLDATIPIATTFFAAKTATVLVDAYSGSEEARNQAITFVLITAGLGLFGIAWRSLSQYIDQLIRFRVESAVDDMMYQKFLSLEFWRYDDKETLDIKDKAMNFSRFFTYVFDRLFDSFSSLLTLALAIVAIAYVNPWLSLLLLLAVIPGSVIQVKLSRKQLKHWNDTTDVRRTKGRIDAKLASSSSIIQLRLYGLAQHLMKQRQQLRNTDEKTRIRFEREFIGLRLLGQLVEAIAEFSALIWTVLQIAERAQPVGQFIYVQQIVSRALNASNVFIMQLSYIDEDLGNITFYDRFSAMPSAVTGTGAFADTAYAPQIALYNVGFAYPEAKVSVLEDINLTIESGDHIAIVGENGAGKTTLIRLLLGLYIPSKGRILLDGRNLHEYDLSKWHGQIGTLMQDYESYDFASVRENVWFGDVKRENETLTIHQALVKGRADEFSRKLPKGIETPTNTDISKKDGTKLSGGQWQRLALARSFFRDPNILVLDEPTSAIDAIAEAKIFDHVLNKMTKKTIITISHRLSTVRKADRIYVLQDGRIVQEGTYKELISTPGEFTRMFESQLKD